jgi:hypothetical protein
MVHCQPAHRPRIPHSERPSVAIMPSVVEGLVDGQTTIAGDEVDLISTTKEIATTAHERALKRGSGRRGTATIEIEGTGTWIRPGTCGTTEIHEIARGISCRENWIGARMNQRFRRRKSHRHRLCRHPRSEQCRRANHRPRTYNLSRAKPRLRARVPWPKTISDRSQPVRASPGHRENGFRLRDPP